MTTPNSPEIEREANEIKDCGGKSGAAEKTLSCAEMLAGGKRCRMAALSGESYCLNHSESEAAERIRKRRIANSIAARQVAVLETKDELGSAVGLRHILERLIRALAEANFDSERARTLLAAMKMLNELGTSPSSNVGWEDIDQNWKPTYEVAEKAGESE